MMFVMYTVFKFKVHKVMSANLIFSQSEGEITNCMIAGLKVDLVSVLKSRVFHVSFQVLAF